MAYCRKCLLCAFVLCFSALFCAFPNDLDDIVRRGELRAVFTASDQPPFYFVGESGKLEGYDVDIASKIADALGVKLVVSRDAPSFNDLVTQVSQKKADIAVSKLSRTLVRAKAVKFSAPYMTFRQGLLFNRLLLAKVTTEEKVKSFVRNYTGSIGVIEKSSYASFAKVNFPNAQIKEYATWEAAVEALLGGEVLSLYRDELEIKKVLSSTPQSSLILKPIYFTDLTDPIAIAVHADNSQFLYWLNIFLDSQSKLSADEVLEKYKKQ